MHEQPVGYKRLSPQQNVYTPKFKWEGYQLFNLYLYLGILFILIYNLPNSIWSPDYKQWIIMFGMLGVWRYLWWFTHFIRALIYNQVDFANLRYQVNQMLDDGWRPNRVVFMITAYTEGEHVIEKMLSSINREADIIQRPCEVYIASAGYETEKRIEKVWGWLNPSPYVKLNIVRQSIEGKRAAIGAALRTISRQGLDDDDPVVFMDADTVLTPGCVLKCIPIFAIDQNIHALTTNEKNITIKPQWLFNWFTLRFTQRSMIMQSHSFSRKVLTLTGRMSLFRGKMITDEDFIYTIEHDHLHHWLWGDFRFLSGDDKSTWYALLKRRAQMLYVPDALVYTIEEIKEPPVQRLRDNMLRWSGNILRNGWRAILLGPGKVGFFAWWCLVDQRIIMFTMMAAPFITLAGCFIHSIDWLLVYIVWILFSRLNLAFVLFYFHRRINMSFPFILYLNQFLTAGIKLYLLFRLPLQKWTNRGGQAMPMQGSKTMLIVRRIMASYITLLMLAVIGFVAIVYMQFIPLLSFNDVDTWLY